MYTKQERKQYNEYRDRACQRAGITKNQYNWLRRKGAELHKLYENNCNGLIDSDIEYNVTTGRIMTKIEDYIPTLHVYYQTDPRGASLYIDRQPIPENNYTQAICIY